MWIPNAKGGHRKLVLTSDEKVSPVINVTRGRRTPDSETSYQHLNAGDILIVSFVSKQSVGKNVFFIDRELKSIPADEKRASEILANLPEPLTAWLDDILEKKLTRFLPAGFGWDGKFSSAEYSKRDRIKEFIGAAEVWNGFDVDWYNNLLDQATMTSTRYLNINWTYAYGLQGVIDDKPLFSDTKTDVIKIKEGTYTVCRDVSTTKDFNTYGANSDFDKLIIVRYGAMVDNDGKPFGCKIECYQK